jgi:STE24 endopeptidase
MTDLGLDANAARLCYWGAVGLIVARCGAEWWLERLNQRHVRGHAGRVPDAFAAVVDEPTYARSTAYTLAQSRFHQIEGVSAAAVLLLVLLSGVLPWAYARFTNAWGLTPWVLALLLIAVGVGLSFTDLPFAWYAQFRLEERFGFNTSTPRLWWMDRLKGTLLSLVLGYPLLVLVLKIVEWVGAGWWLWAWGVVLGFQFLVLLLAPVLILPWFNKFTPLAEGSLRNRLLALAARTHFRAHSIQVMDGSKRSRHSNAFFTGFGRFRKIVLFDTLIQQLAEPELEAVLAHEIGHFRKRHILKLLAGSALMLLAGFYAIAWLAEQAWFCTAFGFVPGSIVPALLLFALLSGAVTFWLSPLANVWSRRFEYQADAYASEVTGEPESLIGALRKLNQKNLSNLTPHPWYSGFHYSHPTLLEREAALRRTVTRSFAREGGEPATVGFGAQAGEDRSCRQGCRRS